MRFGWKWLIPIGLIWIVAVSVVQGVRQFGSVDRKTLIIALVVIAVVGVVATLLAGNEKAPPPQVDEPEPFDAFADGYPVPPLPGQVLPPSPRRARETSGTLEVSAVAVDAPVAPGDTAEEEDRG
jgi:NADH-quinone oxidoreductase subunit H